MSNSRAMGLARRAATTYHSALRSTYVPRRHAGSKDVADPGSAQNQDARLVRQPPSSDAVVEHNLDYDAHADHGTSYVDLWRNVRFTNTNSAFSLVPKRVMDGSEPGQTVAAAVLSGAPIDLQARTVR